MSEKFESYYPSTIIAVKYIIDVWDEVTGEKWRESPDHVQQKFIKAEKELLKNGV